MPDIHGYPTEQELDYIKNYDYLKEKSFEPLVEFIEGIWWAPEWGFKHKVQILQLSTGGWSGNEDIIEALSETMFWTMCWKKSIRGGHYWFELPKLYEG